MGFISRTAWVFVVAFIAIGGCGNTDDADSRADALRPSCGLACGGLVCDVTTEVNPEVLEVCADNCSAHVAPAAEHSEACAVAYESLIDCVAGSTCEERMQWGMDPTISAVCRSDADALAEACPGFVYAFSEPP